MSAGWIFWAILVASAIHVAEEYFGGFIGQITKVLPGVTVKQFAAVNAIFLILCLLGALAPPEFIVYSMAIAALIGLNAFIHIGAAIRLKGYSAGLITSLILYLPLAAYAFYGFVTGGALLFDIVVSVLLGAFIMALAPATILAWLFIRKSEAGRPRHF